MTIASQKMIMIIKAYITRCKKSSVAILAQAILFTLSLNSIFVIRLLLMVKMLVLLISLAYLHCTCGVVLFTCQTLNTRSAEKTTNTYAVEENSWKTLRMLCYAYAYACIQPSHHQNFKPILCLLLICFGMFTIIIASTAFQD